MHADVVQDNHAQGVEDSIAAVYDWLQAQKQASKKRKWEDKEEKKEKKKTKKKRRGRNTNSL